MRQSKPNPICKGPNGVRSVGFTSGKVHIHQNWGWKCECGESFFFRGYGRATRKLAKDSYHGHRKSKHGGPGLGV